MELPDPSGSENNPERVDTTKTAETMGTVDVVDTVETLNAVELTRVTNIGSTKLLILSVSGPFTLV